MAVMGSIGFSGMIVSRDPRTLLLKHYAVTGASLTFHSKYLDLLLPIPEGWIHDAWIALIISNISVLSIIDEPTFAYRQHGSNLYGAPRRRRNDKDLKRDKKYELEAQLYNEAFLRLRKFSDKNPNIDIDIDFKINCLKEKVNFLYVRGALPHKRMRHLPQCLYRLVTLHYHRYARGWKHFIRDLVIV
jgi:hypothetical protein